MSATKISPDFVSSLSSPRSLFGFTCMQAGAKRVLRELEEVCNGNNWRENSEKISLLLDVIIICGVQIDFARDFGILGGFRFLKMLSAIDDSSLNEKAAEGIASILSSGCSYPVIDASSVPLANQMPKVYKFHYYDNDSKGKDRDESQERDQQRDISVFIRSVPHAMLGLGQKSVGYVMWTAAEILSRWLCKHNFLLKWKTVLEVGAGLGLCGLASAQFASLVTLSDFNTIVLRHLFDQISINKGDIIDCDDGDNRDTHYAPIHDNCECEVRFLDWNKLSVEPFSFTYTPSKSFGMKGYNSSQTSQTSQKSLPSSSRTHEDKDDNVEVGVEEVEEGKTALSERTVIVEACGQDDDTHEHGANTFLSNDSIDSGIVALEHGRKYDILLGSDMICCESDAIGVVKCILTYLSPKGLAIFIIPQPQHRWGTEALIPALNGAGLKVYHRPIVNSSFLNMAANSQGARSHRYERGEIINELSKDITDTFHEGDDDDLTAGIVDASYFSWFLVVVQR